VQMDLARRTPRITARIRSTSPKPRPRPLPVFAAQSAPVAARRAVRTTPSAAFAAAVELRVAWLGGPSESPRLRFADLVAAVELRVLRFRSEGGPSESPLLRFVDVFGGGEVAPEPPEGRSDPAIGGLRRRGVCGNAPPRRWRWWPGVFGAWVGTR
jgi:hypothetical protein